jgi:hypothetical protein
VKYIGKVLTLIHASVGWPIFIFSASYWIFDSIIDTYIFHEGDFLTELLTPEPMCLALRLINLLIITAYAVFTHWMITKRKKAEAALHENHAKLERNLKGSIDVISETIEGKGPYAPATTSV